MRKPVEDRSCPNPDCAMQADLVSKRLSFREIFMGMAVLRVFAVVLLDIERPLDNLDPMRMVA